MNKPLILSLTILGVLIGGWFFRWDVVEIRKEGVLTRYKTDRWTGYSWVEKYGINRIIEEKPYITDSKLSGIIRDHAKSKGIYELEEGLKLEENRKDNNYYSGNELAFETSISYYQDKIEKINEEARKKAPLIFSTKANSARQTATYIWAFGVGAFGLSSIVLFLRGNKIKEGRGISV